MKNLRISLLICLMIVFLNSCGSTRIVYVKDKVIESALMNDAKPFTVNRSNSINIPLDNWKLQDISISSKGNYLAMVSILVDKDRFKTESKLEIYDFKAKKIIHSYSSKDFYEKFKIFKQYGKSVYLLNPYKVGFKDDNTLVIQVEPHATSQLNPLNAQLELDIENNAEIDSRIVERGDYTYITNLPKKTQYSFEIRNGVMYVDNVILSGMPAGITMHDQAFIKKL